MRASILVLSALACQPAGTDGAVTGGVQIAATPSTVAIYGPAAEHPGRLLVRSVDIDLLSSGPATVTASVGGASIEVAVDGRGYGVVDLAEAGAVDLGGIGQASAVIGELAWTSTWSVAHLDVPPATVVETGSLLSGSCGMLL